MSSHFEQLERSYEHPLRHAAHELNHTLQRTVRNHQELLPKPRRVSAAHHGLQNAVPIFSCNKFLSSHVFTLEKI